jgi:tetratricopeptide (TPR) repeat protein
MSLTTVAAIVPPDETLAKLPPSRPERFQRTDFIAAGIVFFVTLGVYIATLAPNVTLEDSGELITAAAKFGVGHPPGYPLWTMSGFLLSHLLPFGGLAWRINLLCALFGAISNAVLTLLACHSGRWLLQRWTEPEHQAAVRPYVFYMGLLVGLVIGFSDVMWSQAVISAVHGTLNALFINLVLLFFYLWMIEPKRTHRLILAVFVFSLGLTNHHTLVQIIPAFLFFGALLLEVTPAILSKPSQAPQGIFLSVFLAVNLFSLSILIYISWLSGDNELQTISQTMAKLILGLTVVVSFFYLKEFRLRLFLLGAATAVAVFAYGYYLLDPGETDTLRYTAATAHHFWQIGGFTNPGWLQGLVANARAGHPEVPRHVEPAYAWWMLIFTAVALGLLYTSQLNRRLIIGVFAVGWLGLVPYSYERFASGTHPPMNWGYAAERAGFYYEVSREQYPKSLPTLVKITFGKAIGVVSKDYNPDATIGQPDYWPRLAKTAYYYGDNLQQNFTVPLIFLTLAILFFIRRCDWPQINWFLFLGAAFFFVGFLLQIIAPQEGFDIERNLQYKVFHLQSHCIFVLLMGYGALALMAYLHELMPEVPAQTGVIGFGMPALFLSLLPLWSNFDACNQAGHWFGYNYGADMMRPMDKNAVYFGGSDPGRFVPTFMAFVESQQDNRWKREPGFDRRDVTVITQNALCDTYYSHYIRDQYDARFRPKTWTPFERWLGRDRAYPEVPVACTSNEELVACWEEYDNRPDVAARVAAGGAALRQGSNDVFEINGIVAQKIFEKNKKDHTFYIEQSVPITWMYPYLLPAGLIFKLNPEPLNDAEFAARGEVAADRKFWDAYSQKLLSDPRFRIDTDAILTFGKLAFWHADLYRVRHMDKEQEYWLRMALALCPQLSDAVNSLARLLMDQKRFDDAVAMVQQAQLDDPRNDGYTGLLKMVNEVRAYGRREKEMRTELAKSPYDVQLNLDLARLLQDEGKLSEVNERLQSVAGLTNWSHEAMAGIVQYYVDQAHNPEAAIAFLAARAKIDPSAYQLVYTLAALDASAGHNNDALKYLAQALTTGDTNVIITAKIDPRFAALRADPRFQAIINGPPRTNHPASNAPATNAPATNAPAAKTPMTNSSATNPPGAKAPKSVKKKSGA